MIILLLLIASQIPIPNNLRLWLNFKEISIEERLTDYSNNWTNQIYQKECHDMKRDELRTIKWIRPESQQIEIPSHKWWATIHPNDPYYPVIIDWSLKSYILKIERRVFDLNGKVTNYVETWWPRKAEDTTFTYKATVTANHCFLLSAIGQYPIFVPVEN